MTSTYERVPAKEGRTTNATSLTAASSPPRMMMACCAVMVALEMALTMGTTMLRGMAIEVVTALLVLDVVTTVVIPPLAPRPPEERRG